MSLSEQLRDLHDLHVRGFLTDAQFSVAKARAIEAAGQPAARPATPLPVPPALAPVPGPPAPIPPPPPLNPVVPGVGLALGASSIATGGLTG